MRRIVMAAAAAIAALAMAIPGVALAAHRHGAHHHGAHHRHHAVHRAARHHRRHHRRARHRRARRMRRRRHAAHHAHLVRYSLATPLGEEGKEAETPESTETPEPGSGEEVTTTPPSESIGTVATVAEGTLSIKLTNGTVVSGKVTEETRLLCVSSEPPTFTEDDRGMGDDQSGEDRDQGEMSGGEGEEGMEGGTGEHGDGPPMAHDSSFDHPYGGFSFAPCEPTALTPETAVREAELRLTPQGAVWERVVLVS